MTPVAVPRTATQELAALLSAMRPDWTDDDIQAALWGALGRSWPWPRVAIALVRLATDSECDRPQRVLDAPELARWRHPMLFGGTRREPAAPESARLHADRIRRMLPQTDQPPEQTDEEPP